MGKMSSYPKGHVSCDYGYSMYASEVHISHVQASVSECVFIVYTPPTPCTHQFTKMNHLHAKWVMLPPLHSQSLLFFPFIYPLCLFLYPSVFLSLFNNATMPLHPDLYIKKISHLTVDYTIVVVFHGHVTNLRHA